MTTAKRKIRVGRVVSAKMEKTIIVAVERRRTHRLYHKAVRRITRFKAHDESGIAHEGDLVWIEETRPLSRDKRWRLMEVVETGTVPVLAEAPAEQGATE